MKFQFSKMKHVGEFTEAMAMEAQGKNRRVLVWDTNGFRFFGLSDIKHYSERMAEHWKRQSFPATDNSPLPVFSPKPPNCWPFAYWTVIEAVDDDDEMYRRGR